MEKTEILRSHVKMQFSGSNYFASIPGPVRSVLQPKKGDVIEYIVYSDKSVEIRVKDK